MSIHTYMYREREREREGAKHRAKFLNLDKDHMGAPCITLVIFPQV